MSVLTKFSSFNPSAHSRVGTDGCDPIRLSVRKISNNKQKLNTLRIASDGSILMMAQLDVVETVSRRGNDLCCVQECRWKSALARMLQGK